MKNVLIVLLLAAFTFGIQAQELDSLKAIMDKKNGTENAESPDKNTYAPVIVEEDGDEVNVKVMDKDFVKVYDGGDSTYVSIGNNDAIQVIEHPDSTKIRVGNKEISIVENDNDTDISFKDITNEKHHHNPKFRGHWAGFEWGINNFLDNDFTLSREGDAAYMDLNTSRSWVINLNFAQYSLGFGTSHIGLLTGLGFEFNNYYFDGDNSIVEENDQVVELPIIDTTNSLSKSKLTTTFLRIPLLLEFQFPNTVRSKRGYISAGLITGLKLGSHTKVVYKDDSGKDKDKNKDDFNINPFRFGLTARIGFGGLSVFGDYYFTPMFVEDKGPDLHPFSVGLALAF
jgi:hypothetical protein